MNKQPKRQYKTYRERAEYLAEINPTHSDIFYAIGVFFGEDEIPPLPTPKETKKGRKTKK